MHDTKIKFSHFGSKLEISLELTIQVMLDLMMTIDHFYCQSKFLIDLKNFKLWQSMTIDHFNLNDYLI